MKWWKKLCAAALALSMPVLASAEAKLVDTQTFARSITLGRASDTYVTREDWRDTLRAMDGTALSESYADISAQEKGLYYEVANENGVNQTGLMDAAGTLLIPMTYSDFTYVGNGWVVAVTLEETTDEKSDYRAMFGGGHYNVVRGGHLLWRAENGGNEPRGNDGREHGGLRRVSVRSAGQKQRLLLEDGRNAHGIHRRVLLPRRI